MTVAEGMKVSALAAVERLDELLLNLTGSHRDGYAKETWDGHVRMICCNSCSTVWHRRRR